MRLLKEFVHWFKTSRDFVKAHIYTRMAKEETEQFFKFVDMLCSTVIKEEGLNSTL